MLNSQFPILIGWELRIEHWSDPWMQDYLFPAASLLLSRFHSRRLAYPIRRIFQLAGPLVFCKLWIGAQRTCETVRSISHHLVGRDSLFNPLFNRADRVERVHSWTAAT